MQQDIEQRVVRAREEGAGDVTSQVLLGVGRQAMGGKVFCRQNISGLFLGGPNGGPFLRRFPRPPAE